MDNPNKIIKTIRFQLSEEMIKRIDDYGKNNLSFGKVVRQALDEFLSENKGMRLCRQTRNAYQSHNLQEIALT